MVKVNFKRLDKNAHAPTYGSEYAAGADLYALTKGETVRFSPGETKMIHTGLAVEIPVGYAGLVYARSGIATKRGLAPANKVGVSTATTAARLWSRSIITQTPSRKFPTASA